MPPDLAGVRRRRCRPLHNLFMKNLIYPLFAKENESDLISDPLRTSAVSGNCRRCLVLKPAIPGKLSSRQSYTWVTKYFKEALIG
ncbi:hypothetical protein SK128_024673 [Halocaridina rubra]|uniref:Uncharacterized protein n=1 Tax=Halocaridina rubra TaxID=373956 RepID=A0AAN8XEY8_HALRR